jgi:hypothetical protein
LIGAELASERLAIADHVLHQIVFFSIALAIGIALSWTAARGDRRTVWDRAAGTYVRRR